MPGFFKKAMGLFVEFDEAPGNSLPQHVSPPGTAARVVARQALNSEELNKFESHFEKLFEQANLPGPDYFEFMRMNETLEQHIKDDKARLSATFASLAHQGLTKDILIATAHKYKELIAEDRTKFERSASQKGEQGIGAKRAELTSLEETARRNGEAIQKLTEEINHAHQAIAALKTAITTEEEKLQKNRQGYLVASDAMLLKIDSDVQQIKNEL